MKKKIISLLLALALLLGLMPAAALGDSGRSQRQNMIDIAASQVGYRETAENHTKYGKWYGMDGQPWCAMFLSWCARRAGVPQSVIPNFASCTYGGVSWFKNNGLWKSADYTPRGGDLVFFDFEEEDGSGRDGKAEHVALVEYATGRTIYTIEGNTDNEMVERRARPRDGSVLGFGVPNYGSLSGAAGEISVSAAQPPESMWQGDSFKISGKVSSGREIIWLYMDIRDPDGHFYQAVQTDPEEKTVDIADLGAGIKFEKLPTGRYSLYIEAGDSAYNFVQKSYSFVVYGDSYEIAYDANGGSGAPETQTKPHNETVSLSDAEPSRERYRFLGWSTRPDAEAAEYSPGAEYTDNFSVKLYAVWQAKNYAAAEVVEPTCSEQGYTVYTCTDPDCDESFTDDYVPMLGHHFENGVCTRCGKENPFTDINAEGRHKPFTDAILWAAEQGITTGYGDGVFAPDKDCSRAQVVTFLWRAAGSPEPESSVNPFDDVNETDQRPYYKAILWAVEQGITNGLTATEFSPNGTCTRAQFVTFLWRYMDKPANSGVNPFTDVAENSYYDAILWAAESGVTTGYGDGIFRPSLACSRAHVVTFIYRAVAE